MSLRISGALALLFLAACAQIPGKTDIKADKRTEKLRAGQPKLPVQDLTSPMLFDFLLAETAAQRGDQEIAVRTYLKLATNDAGPASGTARN